MVIDFTRFQVTLNPQIDSSHSSDELDSVDWLFRLDIVPVMGQKSEEFDTKSGAYETLHL